MCETGIITPDELFLGVTPVEGDVGYDVDGDGYDDDANSSSNTINNGSIIKRKIAKAHEKKRKTSSGSRNTGSGSSSIDDDGMEVEVEVEITTLEGVAIQATSTTTTTPPRVLRSLARIAERFGKLLEDFQFQSLVEGASNGLGDQKTTGDSAAENASSFRERQWNRKSSQGRGHGSVVIGGRSLTVEKHLSVLTPSFAVNGGGGTINRLLPLEVDDPGVLPTERATARLARAVLLRRGFSLLAACLSRAGCAQKKDEMAALFVKEELWTRNVHMLLIYSLVWPWAGGLLPRPSDGAEVEQCELFF